MFLEIHEEATASNENCFSIKRPVRISFTTLETDVKVLQLCNDMQVTQSIIFSEGR
jgi:hypothetical protein